MTRRAALMAGAVVALVAAGCGSSTTGDPQPSAPSTPASPPAPRTTTSAPAGSLAAMQPCQLLTPSDLQKLGFASVQGQRSDASGSRGCKWHHHQFGITVDLRQGAGMDSFKLSKAQGGQPVTDVTINGRKGEQQRTNFDCAVALPVSGGTSRVDVTVSTGDTSTSCAGARQAATLVERHLPPT